jgi:tetratricopeptide (TPR) repeat protein
MGYRPGFLRVDDWRRRVFRPLYLFSWPRGPLNFLVRRCVAVEELMADSSKPKASVDVFISYSHKDEELKQELLNHLAGLKRRGLISGWHDGEIGAGREWEKEISEHLEKADIILLLISSNFFGSDFCYDIELKRAMKRHDAGEARVIPIILREYDLAGAPFSKLKALPKDGKAVTSRAWMSVDEAFRNVAEGIRRAVEELVEGRIEHLFEKLGVAESQRNWPNAINLGQRILALLPDNKDALARTAWAYFSNLTRKFKEKEPYKDLGEPFSSIVWVKGLSTIAGSDEARRELRHAIELDPNRGEFHYWLSAMTYDEEQLANLARAIELDPDNGKYYYVRSHKLERRHLRKMEDTLTQGMDSMSKLRHVKVKELQDEARQRGVFRLDEAAQRDFERAINLGYEYAVNEKQAPDPFSASKQKPGLRKMPWDL